MSGDELKFVDVKVVRVPGIVFVYSVPDRIRAGDSGRCLFGKRSRRAKWKDRRAQRQIDAQLIRMRGYGR